MKTKETEKWSDMTKALKPIIDSCCLKPNELNDLIILLERGEKFEKIVEKYKKYLDKLPTGCNSLKLYQLKKKYFPKED